MKKLLFALFFVVLFGLTSASKIYAANFGFPIGVFEDGNTTNTSQKLTTMMNVLRPYKVNSIMFNGQTAGSASIFNASDGSDFNIYFGPTGDLTSQWFNNGGVTVDQPTANSIAQPLVNAASSHSSVKGYSISDEPDTSVFLKNSLMTTAFKTLDPSRATMFVSVGIDRVGPHFDYSNPDILATNIYPYAAGSAPCSTSMKAFGYPDLDMVDYSRIILQNKPDNTQFWSILQAHRLDGGAFSLRDVTPNDLRLEQWLSLGEGSTGSFWFIYSTEQGWTGLQDNPTLLTEIKSLTNRLTPLQSTFLNIRKRSDKFTIKAPGSSFISTFQDVTTGDYYVIAVNHTCSAQNMQISSQYFNGDLMNLETNAVVHLGDSASYRAGDGAIYKLINRGDLSPAAPIPQPNLVQNPSFETTSVGWATNWSATSQATIDSTTAHTGTNSVKVIGNGVGFLLTQNLNLQPSTNYIMSYWIKSSQTIFSLFPLLRYVELVPTTVINTIPATNKADGLWRRSYTMFKTPADYVSGRVDIFWGDDYVNPQTVWVDDVNICQGTNPDCVAEPWSLGAVPNPPSTSYVSPLTSSCKAGPPGAKVPYLYAAQAVDSHSVLLYFTQAADPVTSYALEYGTSSGNYQFGATSIGDHGAKSYLVKSLSPNTTYYFRVRAGNDCAPGGWSNEISAKTSTFLPLVTGSLGFNLPTTNTLGEEPTASPIATPTTEVNNQTGSPASNYSFSVTITDETGKPISGAQVTIHSQVQTVTTDDHGVAQFSQVEAGDHQVAISYQGSQSNLNLHLTGNINGLNLPMTLNTSHSLRNRYLVIGTVITTGLLLAGLLYRRRRNTLEARL